MAATLADGETVLVNAAREPEIADLATCLRRWARRSRGSAATACESSGSAGCTGASHRILPDRIETGTYMMAAAATGGSGAADRHPARPGGGGRCASSIAPASKLSRPRTG